MPPVKGDGAKMARKKDAKGPELAAPSAGELDVLNVLWSEQLAGGQPLESTLQGNALRVRVPEALSASLPAGQAYVLKLAGAV